MANIKPASKGCSELQAQQPAELFRKCNLTDITLLVEGKELHFAKYPLMGGSSVFTKMIEASEDQSQLKLDDVAYKDMVMFLECLHPKVFQVITDINLEQVATIAYRFQHEGILKKCGEYIVQQFNQSTYTDDSMFTQFFFHLKVADKCKLTTAIQVGLESKRVERAYFVSIEPNLIQKRSILGQLEAITVTGYENNINFRQLSMETKVQVLSRRLRIAEKHMYPHYPR